MMLDRLSFRECCDQFKSELVLDPKLDWKENWNNNKKITDKWKKIEEDLFPEYTDFVDTIESRGKDILTELCDMTIGYNGLNIYQICFWYRDIYEEYLTTANLLDMNEDNQFLVIRDLHYNDEEGCYYGGDLDDYLRDCGFSEDEIRKRNEEGIKACSEYYIKRRKLLSDRLKINTISEIRNVFKHFLCPTVKFRLSKPGAAGIRFTRSGYPISIEDLNRVYNDLKKGKSI